MLRRPRSDDRGASTLEHVGAVAVAALVVAGVATVAAPATDALGQKVSCIVETIGIGSGSCPTSVELAVPASAPGIGGGIGGPTDAEDTDRRDAGRDAARDRGDRGRGDSTQPDPSVPGEPSPSGGLGAPVPGTGVPAPPTPPWEPVDEGAGAHDSEDAGLGDHATETLAEAAANAVAGRWPDASRNLLHFLGNSGEPLEQDVDRMLEDLPEFADAVDLQAATVGAAAVAQARAAGVSGPVTFPVSTPWAGFGYEAGGLVYDDQNWFYALGGWQYSLTGQVTVTPPTVPGGAWTYETSTVTNLNDQYNWDGEKSTTIFGRTVTDEQLAELHRKGLAQEFTAFGRSGDRTTEGSVP